MKREYQRLMHKIDDLEKQIKNCPQGTLVCNTQGDYHKWYQVLDGRRCYIKKDKRELAEQLATKKYLSALLEECKQEKHAIDKYLKYHNLEPTKTLQLLEENPAYRELLKSSVHADSEEIRAWQEADYEQNQKHKEQLIHKSISGNTLRSKSEVLIDIALFQSNIPYRYEAALQLDDITFYPDFMVRHPKSGKIYYWEHFGMMDNSSYAKQAYSKLQMYSLHNLIPSINLITTYETKEKPLTSHFVEQIIEYYFKDK